jgi:Protein of unknown function (DUF935).
MTTIENDGKIEDLESYAAERRLSFADIMSDKYDVVGAEHDPAHGSYVILADRNPGLSPGLATREMGYASPSPWTSWTRDERVPELMDRRGLRTYYDMKRADGTVRGALRLLKTPVMGARWFVEPATDSTMDKNIAKFVEKNLMEELNVPWSRVIEDALLMCDFGYFPFEKVYDQIDGKIKLTKLAPRHPMDINEWLWDENGGPDGIIMDPVSIPGSFNSYSNYQREALNQPEVFIPISKLVVFVLEQEAGDLRGISILRSAYKHYYYKDTMYKIDAIQKERHGIGVPIIKLPAGFSTSDRALAENLGRNLRTNERAHIVVPFNWEVTFAKLEGQPVDCLKSIEHHDMKIKSNILAPFMDEANVNPDSLDVYYKATRYIASTVCDTFNHYVIPQLVDFNFSRGGYPKLRVRRIGEEESLRTLSFAVRNFVGANIIRPDDELEKFIRSELDLPPVDEDSVREQETPQAGGSSGGGPSQAGAPKPPHVGPPKQAPKQGATAGKSNVGEDASGGAK